MNVPLAFTALVGLIISSGFFSGVESAFTSLSPAQVAVIQERWKTRGKLVARLMTQPDRLLTTVLIGNNLMNIGASALATSVTIELFGNGAIGVMTGVLTLVMLIFAEVTPKQLAISNNEFICLHTARFIWILSRALSPVIVMISGFSRLVARISGGGKRRTLTLESILQIIRHAEYLGILEQYKSRLFKNLFRFSEIPVSAVMTHRRNVVSIDRTVCIGAALQLVGETGIARVPVYAGDPEEIVGVVLTRDLIQARHRLDEPVRTIMHKPLFLPENKRIDEAMQQILREHLNIAIVLDEYGGLAGIVTIEDILEEIVGEIYDEHEPRQGGKIVAMGEGTFLLKGDIPLSVANDVLATPLQYDSSDVKTLAGYLTEILERIPVSGESIPTEAGIFTVERMDHNRVVEVSYRPPTATTDVSDTKN